MNGNESSERMEEMLLVESMKKKRKCGMYVRKRVVRVLCSKSPLLVFLRIECELRTTKRKGGRICGQEGWKREKSKVGTALSAWVCGPFYSPSSSLSSRPRD